MVHDQRQGLRQLADCGGSLEEVGGGVQLPLLLDLLLQEGACAGQRLCPDRGTMPVHICDVHLQHCIPLWHALPVQPRLEAYSAMH